MISCVMLETKTYMSAASVWALIDKTAHEKALVAHMRNRNRLYKVNKLKIHYTLRKPKRTSFDQEPP
jgi:hypothetical protein